MTRELEFAFMQPHILLVQDLHSEHVTHTRHKLFSFQHATFSKGHFLFQTRTLWPPQPSAVCQGLCWGKGLITSHSN